MALLSCCGPYYSIYIHFTFWSYIVTHTHKHTNTHIYIQTHTHTYIYIYIHTYTYIYIYIYTYTHTYIYTCTYMHIPIHTHTYYISHYIYIYENIKHILLTKSVIQLNIQSCSHIIRVSVNRSSVWPLRDSHLLSQKFPNMPTKHLLKYFKIVLDSDWYGQFVPFNVCSMEETIFINLCTGIYTAFKQ